MENVREARPSARPRLLRGDRHEARDKRLARLAKLIFLVLVIRVLLEKKVQLASI